MGTPSPVIHRIFGLPVRFVSGFAEVADRVVCASGGADVGAAWAEGSVAVASAPPMPFRALRREKPFLAFMGSSLPHHAISGIRLLLPTHADTLSAGRLSSGVLYLRPKINSPNAPSSGMNATIRNTGL